MFLRANKVPNETNKWIIKRLINLGKQTYWNKVKNGSYVEQHDKFSNCAKFEGSNFKNDTVNAENAKFTN